MRLILPALLLQLVGCGGGSGSGSGQQISVNPTPTPAPASTPTPSPTQTPAPTAGLVAAKLDAAADYMLGTGARAVVVIEDGKVVLERYANGGGATRGEALASGTKSFSCALMVGAEAEGSLSIDELASSVVVPWRTGGSAPQSVDKQQIRIRDLLSVTSGLLNSGVAERR